MPRTKGSKNKTTLIREMRERGCKETLDDIDYHTLTEYHALVMAGKPLPQVAPAVAKTVAPVEKVRIPPEVARPIYEAAEGKLRSMADWYGFEEPIPDRVTDVLVRVYFSETVEEAHANARQALDKFFTTLVSLWSRGRIFGPPTIQNVQARIKKAEHLVEMLEKKGDASGVASQQHRVAQLKTLMPKPGEEPKAPNWF